MILAEQATRSRYWHSGSSPSREIRLTARLEVPGVEGADVDTALLFESHASPWNELIDQHLYDGVHAGIAGAGMPLPDGGVRVFITELSITAGLAADAGEDEVRSVVETVHALASATVSTLWTGLRQPTLMAAT